MQKFSKKYSITSKEVMGVVINGGNTLVETEGNEDMQVSDGFHTMDELYEHRLELFIALCRTTYAISQLSQEIGEDSTIHIPIWRSKFHSDGTGYGGWFLLGIHKEKGQQMTYHLPLSRWDEVSFAETLDAAPEWDGHTSKDVLERLKNL